MVLIPKGKVDYRGIGLVEVMWKVVAVVFKFPDHSLHHLPRLPPWILAGRSTGTDTLDAKLLQQLLALRQEVLYVIFMDLHKAYNALYRSRCLEILEGYCLGP